jgi:hypothetical protein
MTPTLSSHSLNITSLTFLKKIAYVHDKCHKLIHDPKNPLPWFIQYSEGDSRKFYDLKKRMARKNTGAAVA